MGSSGDYARLSRYISYICYLSKYLQGSAKRQSLSFILFKEGAIPVCMCSTKRSFDAIMRPKETRNLPAERPIG